MQVIFSLIHKQYKQHKVWQGYTMRGHTKKIICVPRRLLPPYYNIITLSPNQTEPTYGIEENLNSGIIKGAHNLKAI